MRKTVDGLRPAGLACRSGGVLPGTAAARPRLLVACFLLGLGLTVGCGSELSRDDRGSTSVVRLDAEPPGEHCPSGGTAIHTGIDDDGDGVLNDAEVDDTAYACNGPTAVDPSTVLEGSITVENSYDLAVLQNYERVTGDVRVLFSPSSLSLPVLNAIGRNLEVTGTYATDSLALPSLASIGNRLVLGYNSSLVDLDGVATLRTVSEVVIEENSLLERVDGLCGITSALGSLIIRNNDSLPTCEAEALLACLQTPPGTVLISGNNGTAPCN